jgi:hypothetical protein
MKTNPRHLFYSLFLPAMLAVIPAQASDPLDQLQCVTERVTDAVACGVTPRQDGKLCGYEKVRDAAVCGYEVVKTDLPPVIWPNLASSPRRCWLPGVSGSSFCSHACEMQKLANAGFLS